MRIPLWTNYWAGVRELIGDIREYLQYRREQKLASHPSIQITDDALGTFDHDLRAGWFAMTKDWNGTAISLTLSGDWPAHAPDPAKAAQMAVMARVLWDDEAAWLRRMLDVAERDLLALAGEWQADAGPLNAARFRDRLRISSIAIHEDGTFLADFDDGGLFADHTIEVWGALESGPEGANING